MSTAFVTGCGSGIGRAVARELLDAGHRVVATDPEPDSLEGLVAAPWQRAHLTTLPIDVRDDASVKAAVDAALAAGPVHVLVNNAGVGVFSTQEEADLDAVRDLFEVNVLGVARVTKALLPALRATKGVVVNLSSIAGRMSFPESGFYAATKHAVEAMSEALYEETASFGVRVRVVEPGAIASRFQERAAAKSPMPPATSPYAALRPLWDRRRMGTLAEPQDPSVVARAILASLGDPTPFLRIPAGEDAERMMALRTALSPDAWARFMGARNGAPPSPHVPGDVLEPADVLAGRHDLGPTLAALRAGHLEHWRETETGRAALAALAAR